MLGKITVLLLFLLLVWGNLVAGLKVGLACPDWPLCYGKILPPFRWDIYMEFTHRILGVLTSIFLIILCHKRFRIYSGLNKIIPLLTLSILLLQIVLGGIVVLLKLPVDLTTIHFGIAMIIFSLTFYLAFFDGMDKKPVLSTTNKGLLLLFLSILVISQAIIGALVRHSGAGLACPDFPKCLGFWIPPNLTGIVLTHFLHRVIAYIVLVSALLMYISSYASDKLKGIRTNLMFILALVLVQVLVGVAVVHSKLLFFITAIHITLALLILSTVLYTFFKDMRESQA